MTSEEKRRSVDAHVEHFTIRQKGIREAIRFASGFLQHKKLKNYAEALIRAGEELIRAERELSRESRRCLNLHREHLDGEIMDSWLRATEHYICALELLVAYRTLEAVDRRLFKKLQNVCGQQRASFEEIRGKLNEQTETRVEHVFVITNSRGDVISTDDESVTLPFDHNEDYSVITYKGISYSLNGVDRIVVRCCNESKGAVTMDMIRDKCRKEGRSINTFKMSNIFSGKNRELWGTLIRSIGDGYIIDKT